MAMDSARQSPPPDDGLRQPVEPVPSSETPAVSGPFAGDSTELFFDVPNRPSNDTPTVISKMPPRSATNEEVLNGNLRGRRLAHFELIEPVGVGGMAAVLRARDLQLDRIVALKILPPEMAADPDCVLRFQHEARAAARLDHENVARVYFCGEDQKLYFIAFEFVEGENLRSLVEKRGRLPVAEALHYMLQIATGLAHAAGRGVIHRDIKPSNIIISPNGRAKLVDMGLARSLDPRADGGLTHSGVTLGTFDYISPEQALEPRDADVRSDIYSLGCTFYHVLTGQPPVPEGTAAKKLHHHQHVAPVDPRMLNSEIPDDVAAVLGRMMAKDARQRYQKVEHLVQHLMAALQKLGAGQDLPEGVLFMDAPLPTPPRARPLLLAVLAAVVLVVLIVFLGQAPRPPWAPQDSSTFVGALPSTKPAQPPIPGGNEVGLKNQGTSKPSETLTPQPAKYSYQKTAEPAELVSWLKNEANAVVELNKDLELNRVAPQSGAALVFDGTKLVIQSADPSRPATLHLTYPASQPNFPTVGLLVKNGVVTLRNLRLEIDGRSSEAVLTALVREGGEVFVENCLFVQTGSSVGEQVRMTDVEVKGPPVEQGRPAVTLTNCCFMGVQKDGQIGRGGQQAVTVSGSGRVKVEQCAFGPHAALVAFQGETAEWGTTPTVSMTNCTGLLASETAVCRLERTRGCRLEAADCLFSRPEPAKFPEDAARQAVLVRQVADGLASFTFVGRDNRYHALDQFWVRPTGTVAKTLEDFKKVPGSPAKDDDSRVVADSPWPAESPLAKFVLLDDKSLRPLFQVNVKLREMRQPGAMSKRLVGVETCYWGGDSFAHNLPAIDDPKPPVARSGRVVKPGTDDSLRAIYPTLDAAVTAAEAGDVITIETNDVLTVSPQRLGRLDDLTIRAGTGFRPTLKLTDEIDAEENAFLFRVWDGDLKLEGIDILLKPGKADVRHLAVVAAAGSGSCTFKDCVITLDSGLLAVNLSVFGLVKPTRAAADESLRLVLEDCLVRGHGDLVNGNPARPFTLKGDNLLAALTGSLLHLTSPADAAGLGTIDLQLSRATTYLGGHLIHMTADKETQAVLPVVVKPVNCLFVSGEGKALVQLDGPDLSGDKMSAALPWDGSHNAYNRFKDMLVQMPAEPQKMMMEMRPAVWNQERWKQFARDDALFDRVTLADLPARDEVPRDEFPRFVASRFKVKTTLEQPYGADLDELPKPGRDPR